MKPAAIRLKVTDLDREREFYERAVGLLPVGESDGVVRLGADGNEVVELAARADAAPRPNGTTGLFHLAILVPSREELARALARVLRAGWRLTGASDHLVSEALYLNDPEGNGIELYRDRPREEWRYEGGNVQMSTLPLDVRGLLEELEGAHDDAGGMSAGTHLGHVHLNVADLDAAEAFYAGTLGFDVTVRGYPGALFFATEGYHHHIGVNTWAGPGAPAPPAGSRGLEWFELAVGDAGRIDALARRLEGAGAGIERLPEGVRTRDPSGNGLLITARPVGA
jgi:catechol 2,3-dioxygenase